MPFHSATQAGEFLAEKILEIQWLQDQHDQLYHKDIYQLRPIDKLTHFTLHLGKYTSNFMELEKAERHADLRKRVVDTLIICLSIANTLQVRLGQYTAQQLKEFGGEVHHASADFYAYKLVCKEENNNKPITQIGLVIELLSEVEIMSDTILKFKNTLEASPRIAISESVSRAWIYALAMYSNCLQIGQSQAPWTTAVMNRLIEVEQKNMFYKFLPKRAESFATRPASWPKDE